MNSQNKRETYMVSACLVGLNTRYDGKCKPNKTCMARLTGSCWIPFCPEQLGGLSTPRPAAEIINGDGFDVLQGRAGVLTRSSNIQGPTNISKEFIRGAEQVLVIANFFNVKSVFLKSHSPSCGLTPITGVTAALLKLHGYMVEEF